MGTSRLGTDAIAGTRTDWPCTPMAAAIASIGLAAAPFAAAGGGGAPPPTPLLLDAVEGAGPLCDDRGPALPARFATALGSLSGTISPSMISTILPAASPTPLP
eukprot:CAMPEP_0184386138 /NCGR_PEP_ID=MMETSP0007-20130409/9512_1 /TAXON_ID=97485 /ORGANISM="Prymnesium parvum, Strain Texoma1" /LENGTH=103 /DNA_ID=CAMNT_0026733857 /DNA_START=379 /DNA_END=687 /DNA_ORIENTATION=+